jgi:uncharacterized protein (DUF427 family)
MTADLPDWAAGARSKWTNTGARRPEFAIEPSPGQESVWDYPRPPAIVAEGRLVEVLSGDDLVASTRSAVRVLETSLAPSFYVRPNDVVPDRLVMAPGGSLCEWKGAAEYVALAGAVEPVGWRYPTPFPEFADIAGWVSFYPARVTCLVAGEMVRPQPGGFYGGWITDEIVGPFKGEPGTEAW